MNTHHILGGALALLLASLAPAHAYDWTDMRNIMGQKGEEDKGVLLIKYNRDDLKVKMGDVPVSPEMVFDTWYGFWPMPDGTVMLMGDTVVTTKEMPAVLREIARQGLEISAVHNHLAGEEPAVFFTHFSGHGSAAEMARKARAVLTQTKAPLKEKEDEKPDASINWTPITEQLGKPSESHGDMAEYSFIRREKLTMMGQEMPSTEALETAPEVKFQMLPDGRAISYGEMILTAKEVAPVFRDIQQAGMQVTALHNHMLNEEPRLFFMHWWGVGDPAKLAAGVKAAKSEMNIEKAD